MTTSDDQVVPGYAVLFLLGLSLYFTVGLAAPVANGNGSTKAYPCPLATECQGETDSVMAALKNETYCCHGGAAIVVSVSGVNFRYTKVFFSTGWGSTENGNSEDEGNAISDETSGGDGDVVIVKRSPGSDDDVEDSSSLTYTCVCKPVAWPRLANVYFGKGKKTNPSPPAVTANSGQNE